MGRPKKRVPQPDAGAPFIAEEEMEMETVAEATTVAVSVPPATTATTALIVDPEEIARLTPDALKEQAILLASREKARLEHEKAEALLRQADPNARLSTPTILRDLSDDKGRELMAQLDMTFAERSRSDVLRRELMAKAGVDSKAKDAEEAQDIHDLIATHNERVDAKESAAKEAAKAPQHINGNQVWNCESCHKRFNSAPMDLIKRKAAAEPDWRFACPLCQSTRVRMIADKDI